MFGGGEEGLPFHNLTSHSDQASYVWIESYGGYPKVLLLPRIFYFSVIGFLFRLGVNSFVLQALTFFVLIFTGSLSVFYLIKETLGEKLEKETLKYTAFLSGIFYLLNPFSMVQIWGRGIYAQFFAFALVPLFLLFFVLGIKRKNLIYLVLGVMTSYIFSPAFVFPTQVLVLWVPVVTYVVFNLWINRRNKKEISATLLSALFLVIFWLLANSWWLWPYSKTLGANVSKLGNIEYNLGSLKGISKESPLTVVARLTHKFLFTGLYGDTYLSFPFKLLSWLIPLISIFSLGVFKKLRSFGFYASIFLISLFGVMGTNKPFGWLFVWLFKNISFFQAFRNPYEKMGLVLTLAYSPFFALGVLELSNKIYGFFKNKISVLKRTNHRLFIWAFVIPTLGLYVWPMWTGQFAGGTKINPWIEVPMYYKEADDWIQSQDSNSRIIQLPLNPGDGVLTSWRHPYRGIDPSVFIFSNPSIGGNTGFNKIYYNVLLERFGVLQKDVFGPDPDISKSDFRSKDLSGELEKLNVRYIVLHRDLDETLSGMKGAEETAQYLDREKNIEKVKTFGQLDIYEVRLSDKVAHIYSPDTKVSYKKVNPTLYTFKVENASKPIDIYFLEMYAPDWELFVDREKIQTHSTVFSYANAWELSQTGTYEGYLRYQPQDYVDEGLRVTLITASVLTAIMVAKLLRRRT